jgi:hypothetical protein
MTSEGGTLKEAAQPLWSVELDQRPGSGGTLLTDGGGGCLVVTSESLTRYAPDGTRDWQVVPLGSVYEPPVAGADGRISWVEGAQVVTRNPGDGEVLGSFTDANATELAWTPWGDLLYRAENPDGTATLRCRSVRGEEIWARSFRGTGPLVQHPASFGDVVLVHFDGKLRAFAQDGTERWTASRAGFQDTTESADEQMWSFPVVLGPSRLLAGFEWPAGRGLYLVDTEAGEVTPFAADRAVLGPLAVLPGAEFRLAMRGPRYEIREKEWEWSVVVLDSAGRLSWEHRLPADMKKLTAGRDGRLVIAGTPSRKRWESYHKWYDLSAESYVQSVGNDGRVEWTWPGPGPLTHLPVVGAGGTLYVGSEGKLWALPAHGKARG